MHLKTIAASLALSSALMGNGFAHPLDGLSGEEYQKIKQILTQSQTIGEDTLFPLIELKEPPKADVLAWKEGDPLDRKAMVQFTTDEGFSEAIVNITSGTVESVEAIKGSGQPMVLFAEFMGALGRRTWPSGNGNRSRKARSHAG